MSSRLLAAVLATAAPLAGAPALAAPAAGDVVITEILIDAPSADEWFELTNLSDSTADLSGCVIAEGETGTENAHTVTALSIPAGGIAVLVKSGDCAAWSEQGSAGTCEVAADYTYGNLSFNNGDPEELTLTCGGVEIDRISYDWTEMEGSCPADSSCAAGLAPDRLSAEGNDDFPQGWCIPLSAPPHHDENGLPSYGTPGAANECAAFEWPEAGDVVVTEIMVAPQGAPEWFEVWNTRDRDVELTLCSIRKYRVDDEGWVDPSTVKSYEIGSDGRTLWMGPGAVQVFAYKECFLDGALGSGDGGEDLPSSCPGGEYAYSTVTFTNDGDERVALVCPDADSSEEVLVDEAPYDPTSDGVREGHSLMFDPTGAPDPAAANDDRDAWCEAAFSQCFLEPTDEDCNFGTPGVVGECLTDDVDWPDGGPTCRCAAATPGQSSAVALLLLGAALRRSRGVGGR
ncbi:lamin tail domain-containing protein [Myxococcota bacterium]|nr:lamin tail domain-containing protein [Myxococcota bacterium]